MVALTLSSPSSCPTTPLPPPNYHVQASRPAGLLPSMTRRALWVSISATSSTAFFPLSSPCSHAAAAAAASPPIPTSKFFEVAGSGGVKAFDIITGDGDVPAAGDQVAIHYYGRLAAKQGWRFDSTYDHKDDSGDSIPFVFVLGSNNVIPGIQSAVETMRVRGIRRVIIPPSQGYQNTSQEPLPPNFFDRQRLFTTIFNPTRLANGEGSTLGTLIFDVELVSVRHPLNSSMNMIK